MKTLKKGDLVVYCQSHLFAEHVYSIAEVIRITKTLAVCELQNGSKYEVRFKKEPIEEHGELIYPCYPQSSCKALPYIGKYIDVYNIQQSLLRARLQSRELNTLIQSKPFIGIKKENMDIISKTISQLKDLIGRELEEKSNG